jgi:hypothetical protein
LSNKLEQDGIFLAEIKECGLSTNEQTGACSWFGIFGIIAGFVETDAEKHTGHWASWAGTDFECEGTVTVRNGQNSKSGIGPNEIGIIQLVDALGWYSGNLEDLRTVEGFQNKHVKLVVKRNEWKGKVTYRADKILRTDAETTMGRTKITDDKLTRMQEDMGQTLRTIAASSLQAPTPVMPEIMPVDNIPY